MRAKVVKHFDTLLPEISPGTHNRERKRKWHSMTRRERGRARLSSNILRRRILNPLGAPDGTDS
jgi:hypothetical protein